MIPETESGLSDEGVPGEISQATSSLPLHAGLLKIASCRRKSPPTCMVSIGWLLCLAVLYRWRFLNKISMDWPLTLTTQPSTSKLSNNPGRGFIHKAKYREDILLYMQQLAPICCGSNLIFSLNISNRLRFFKLV